MLITTKHITPYFELAVWITGLVLLAFMNPAAEGHYSLCVFKWVGFSFCPGCGLGHSLSWLMHGHLQESFEAHPLGLFAFGVLGFRIIQLIKQKFFHFSLVN